MFTGIITDIGEVVAVREARGDRRFDIKTNYDLGAVDIGASIACSGCCLTVVEKDAVQGWFAVEVSNESLSKTAIGNWQKGTRVNLERSLKLGDEMGGHMVSGHVDGLAELLEVKPDAGSWRLTLKVPSEFAPMIAPKGSIALDGISLTVNEVMDSIFGVNIIPHTWEVTTLSDRKPGDRLHMEIDLMARYAKRILEYKA